MHERRRAERRLRNRAAIEERGGAVRDIDIHPRSQFHKQIVRMLPVDERLAIGGFAGREQVGIAARIEQRLGAHHGAQLQTCASKITLRHQHRHRLDISFVAAARAGLFRVDQPAVTVRHPLPAAAKVEMQAGHHSFGLREARGA